MDGIVPDIIDEAPSKLTVIYGDKNIEIGQELTPLEVRNQPTIVWEAKPGTYYFLAMIDPDAPSKIDQSKGQVMHWMVGNILGNDLSTGDVFTEYVGSGPPKDSGLHRYIFLVYEQKDKLQFEEQKNFVKSSHWKVKLFYKKICR